jgi:hypothetical protein
MAYKINGTDLTLQPTEGKWVDREEVGKDGNGRVIYSAPREFEMKFNLSSPSDWAQMRNFFSAIGSTGTVVVDLPEYGASAYQFRAYSGCILNEPTTGPYFEEHIGDFKLIVSRIIT